MLGIKNVTTCGGRWRAFYAVAVQHRPYSDVWYWCKWCKRYHAEHWSSPIEHPAFPEDGKVN